MFDWFAGRSCLWWTNEFGILLEIAGAAILVKAAFRSRGRINDLQDTWDTNLTERLKDTIAAQAFTELKGFGLLAMGLTAQMIGGLE